MSLSDNSSGHGSKLKKVARKTIASSVGYKTPFVDELVSAQSLPQVWGELKKATLSLDQSFSSSSKWIILYEA